MVAGKGQIIYAVFFYHERPFRPAMQERTHKYRLAEGDRRGHLASQNALIVRPEGIALAILIQKNRKVNIMTDVGRDFAKRAERAFAFEHIMPQSVRRGIHIKRTVLIGHLGRKGHQAGKFLLGHHRAFRLPVYQVPTRPAEHARIGAVQIIAAVVAKNKWIGKVAVPAKGVMVAPHAIHPLMPDMAKESVKCF